jgi:hypothetical protein
VGALANAEIYCMALGNIYSDPNYHNLNHWAILQTLARKGVYVSEPSDAQLTETTLIQTNPLRMVSVDSGSIYDFSNIYKTESTTGLRIRGGARKQTRRRECSVITRWRRVEADDVHVVGCGFGHLSRKCVPYSDRGLLFIAH